MDKRDKTEIIKVLSVASAIIITAIIGLIFVGCSPRVCVPTEIRNSTDTIIRTVFTHDTVTFTVPVEVEKNVTRDTVSHLENTYAKSDAKVQDGLLFHSLETKPHTVYVPVVHEVHDTTIITQRAETIVKEVERNLTKWQSFSMVLGWIMGAILLLFVVGRIALRCIKRV